MEAFDSNNVVSRPPIILERQAGSRFPTRFAAGTSGHVQHKLNWGLGIRLTDDEWQQGHDSGAFDGIADQALMSQATTVAAAGLYFPVSGDETLQQANVLIIDVIQSIGAEVARALLDRGGMLFRSHRLKRNIFDINFCLARRRRCGFILGRAGSRNWATCLTGGQVALLVEHD